MVSGVMNRSQTWAESAEDPLISEGKLFICGTERIYFTALVATCHIPRAAEPGSGWTCEAGAIRFPGRPLLAMSCGAGRALTKRRGSSSGWRGAVPCRALPGSAGSSRGLRCPLVSRAAVALPGRSGTAGKAPSTQPGGAASPPVGAGCPGAPRPGHGAERGARRVTTPFPPAWPRP